MKLKLITFTNNLCTVGKLYHRGKQILVTVEKKWQDNEKDKSCIPAGIYGLTRRISPSKGETYYFSNPKLGVTLNTPGTRTFIQIDKANVQSELLGCVAVGKEFSIYKNQWSITESKTTKEMLMKLLNDSEEVHTIEIMRY